MASTPESKITKVQVEKVAVWRVNGALIADIVAATKETRRLVIEELVAEQSYVFMEDGEDLAFWMADNWERIEVRVKAAMAGT